MRVTVWFATSRLRLAIGNVTISRIDEVAMNLVRTDHQPVAKTNLGHLFQFCPGENPAHRVVGIAQKLAF
jgi:hypothetical protein